jgi:alkylation response protein AidB-like acyl-CoA dehydrogenase
MAAEAVSLPSLLDAVREIEPILRAQAKNAEADRRQSEAAAEAIRLHGLNRMWRPRALGGLEVDAITGFRVLEEISRIDSATGWNLLLSSGIDSFGGWFDDGGAREIYGAPETTFAGSFFPPRRAVAVDGGYRVTGQTPFCSGAHQARWFLGLAQVHDGETPRVAPDGAPVTIMTMFPAEKATILDTWHTLGMRGTGSHDIVISEVFVPSRHTALLAPYDKPGEAYQGPLYKLTIWSAIATQGVVSLGIASAAIDDLIELAGRKTPSYLATPLRDRVTVQAAIGKAQATTAAARAYLYEALREVWEKALAGQLIDMPGKMKLQLAATHAVAAGVKVVRLIHETAGTSGIREEYRFQRHFRDAHTVSQHAYTSAARYESGGQYMLGVPIEWPFYGL